MLPEQERITLERSFVEWMQDQTPARVTVTEVAIFVRKAAGLEPCDCEKLASLMLQRLTRSTGKAKPGIKRVKVRKDEPFNESLFTWRER